MRLVLGIPCRSAEIIFMMGVRKDATSNGAKHSHWLAARANLLVMGGGVQRLLANLLNRNLSTTRCTTIILLLFCENEFSTQVAHLHSHLALTANCF